MGETQLYKDLDTQVAKFEEDPDCQGWNANHWPILGPSSHISEAHCQEGWICGHGSQNPRSPMDVLAQRAECLECNNQYVERSPAPLMSRMSDQENKCLACQHSCFFSWHCDIITKLADIAYNAAIGCCQSWSCLALRLPQALSFISSSCHAMSFI